MGAQSALLESGPNLILRRRSPERGRTARMGVDCSLVLPTYNEREPIRMLDPRLRAALAPWAVEILVVDDNSPDGTADLVREFSRNGPYRLVARPGRMGLASAVLDGFKESQGGVIAVMDADGSHPPETLPMLIGPVLRGEAEFVLGSRWAPGGSSPGLVGGRRIMSRVAGALARPLVPVRDPMSGFFAFHRRILERADLRPVGFKIALEVMVRCRPRPILEVPYRFEPRLAGESKLDSGEVSDYLRHLARLYGSRFGQSRRASSAR